MCVKLCVITDVVCFRIYSLLTPCCPLCVFFLLVLQEEFNDLEDVKVGPGGSAPVTSQPTAGQAAGAGMPVFAMPAPPNPTNPFANMATENTSLNASDQATYTPGN